MICFIAACWPEDANAPPAIAEPRPIKPPAIVPQGPSSSNAVPIRASVTIGVAIAAAVGRICSVALWTKPLIQPGRFCCSQLRTPPIQSFPNCCFPSEFWAGSGWGIWDCGPITSLIFLPTNECGLNPEGPYCGTSLIFLPISDRGSKTEEPRPVLDWPGLPVGKVPRPAVESDWSCDWDWSSEGSKDGSVGEA